VQQKRNTVKPRFGYRQHVIDISFTAQNGMYSDILSPSINCLVVAAAQGLAGWVMLEDGNASATVCNGNISSVRGVPAPGRNESRVRITRTGAQHQNQTTTILHVTATMAHIVPPYASQFKHLTMSFPSENVLHIELKRSVLCFGSLTQTATLYS
jgi:hypothetical protein